MDADYRAWSAFSTANHIASTLYRQFKIPLWFVDLPVGIMTETKAGARPGSMAQRTVP